jgi:hypothetical protein
MYAAAIYNIDSLPVCLDLFFVEVKVLVTPMEEMVW